MSFSEMPITVWAYAGEYALALNKNRVKLRLDSKFFVFLSLQKISKYE